MEILVLLTLLYITNAKVLYRKNRNHADDVNDIVLENKKSGSDNWFSGWRPELKHGVDIQTYNFSIDQPGPKGFSTEFSYESGNLVEFKIDNLIYDHILVKEYELKIFRLGFYNGTGARLIDTLNVYKTIMQPKCKFYSISRMTDCSNWNTTITYALGLNLLTGIYVGLPVYVDKNNKELHGSYIPFVIRDSDNSNRNSGDILFKTADLTWVAYNLYGTYNLYRGDGNYSFSSRAKMASYNRPFNSRLSLPSGKFQNFLFGSEYAMIYWLEKLGYSVSYASCADVEKWGSSQYLTKYRVLLSVGHDEYWTQELRDAIYNARENGVHLGFFSGNEFLWKVRWLEEIENDKANGLSPKDFKEDGFDIPSLLKESHRVIYCRKETIDSIASAYPSDWTGTFMDSRFGLAGDPLNSLSGQQNVVNAHRSDAMTVSAADAKLRLWRHTKLFDPNTYSNNSVYTTQSGILGYEWDLYVEDCNRPPGLITFSNTDFQLFGYLLQEFGLGYKGNGTASHRITMYRYISSTIKKLSSLVFAVGTIQWSWALSSKHDGANMTVDYNIQQATINILADMNVHSNSLYNSNRKLVKASRTNDRLLPYSIIESPLNSYIVHPNSILTIMGSARDRGGGRVSAVEVSFDDGMTWKLAKGRKRWTISINIDNFGSPINDCSPSDNFNTKFINIISRAIDDSGWIETYTLRNVNRRKIAMEIIEQRSQNLLTLEVLRKHL